MNRYERRRLEISAARSVFSWHERPTVGFVYDPVPHRLHIIEIAGYVLDYFDIVVAAVLLQIIVRFDGNAVSVFEKRIEQRAVGISARMPYNINLIRGRIDEPQQTPVAVRLQIADGFDVRQITIVVQIGDSFVILVQFVAIAEDDRIFVVSQLAVNMIDLEIRPFGNIQVRRLRIIEIQQQNLFGQ